MISDTASHLFHSSIESLFIMIIINYSNSLLKPFEYITEHHLQNRTHFKFIQCITTVREQETFQFQKHLPYFKAGLLLAHSIKTADFVVQADSTAVFEALLKSLLTKHTY